MATEELRGYICHILKSQSVRSTGSACRHAESSACMYVDVSKLWPYAPVHIHVLLGA